MWYTLRVVRIFALRRQNRQFVALSLARSLSLTRQQDPVTQGSWKCERRCKESRDITIFSIFRRWREKRERAVWIVENGPGKIGYLFSRLHHFSMSFFSGRVENCCSLLVPVVFRAEKFGYFFRKCRSLTECTGRNNRNWLRDVTPRKSFKLFFSLLPNLFPSFFKCSESFVLRARKCCITFWFNFVFENNWFVKLISVEVFRHLFNKETIQKE